MRRVSDNNVQYVQWAFSGRNGASGEGGVGHQLDSIELQLQPTAPKISLYFSVSVSVSHTHSLSKPGTCSPIVGVKSQRRPRQVMLLFWTRISHLLPTMIPSGVIIIIIIPLV